MWRRDASLADNLSLVAFFLAVEVAWVLMAAGLFVALDAAGTVLTRALKGGWGG